MLSNVWQPDEGDLRSVHPGAQRQAGVLSKRWNDGGEDERYEDKAGRQDDLNSPPKKMIKQRQM